MVPLGPVNFSNTPMLCAGGLGVIRLPSCQPEIKSICDVPVLLCSDLSSESSSGVLRLPGALCSQHQADAGSDPTPLRDLAPSPGFCPKTGGETCCSAPLISLGSGRLLPTPLSTQPQGGTLC